MRLLHLLAPICFFTTLLCSGCSGVSSPMKKTEPLRTVSSVDIPKYMGDWRVIANIPYFAERGCVDSIESYALNPDGSIANWFTFRKKSFEAPPKKITAKAKVINTDTHAEWKVYFFGGLVRASYLVLDCDPDYQWTVVGHPSRKYGWIMARSKTLSEKTYQEILNRLEAQGYDPSLFKKVPQLPEQLGAPGFQ
ncbi:MAG: lipocalin [Verrucomicrobia bacterium]|nr:lipocalin [Verrucomicrobiota bacterium]